MPAILAAVYFVTAFAGIAVSGVAGSVADIWIANAIALAFLLRRSRSEWPVLLTAAFVGGLVANLAFAKPLPVSLGLMTANTAEVLIAAYIVTLWEGGPIRLYGNIWAYLRLMIVAAVIAPSIGGLLSAAVINAAFGTPLIETWGRWIEGAIVGAVAVLPVAMMLNRRNFQAVLTGKSCYVVLGLAALAVALAYVAAVIPGRPVLLIGAPVIVAAAFYHPLSAAILACVAVFAIVGIEASGPAQSFGLGGVAVFASAAVIAPLGIALIVQELRDDRARFRLAMDGSAVGMALVGMDHKWMRANKAMADFLGYEEHEIENITWKDITHPDDVGESETQRKRLCAGEIDSLTLQQRYIRKDGQEVWGHLVVSLLRDQISGEARYHIVQIMDMTAMRAAKRALEVNERRLDFALESGGLGVWDHDVVKQLTRYSKAWSAMLGLEPDERSHHRDRWFNLVHPDDKGEVDKKGEAFMSGGTEMFEHVYRMHHADGHWVWVEDRAKIMEHDKLGEPLRVVGVTTDISDRVAAEEALIESEQRWSFALEGGQQGVWDLNARAGKTYYSNRWKSMLGYGPDEIDDNSEAWLSLIHPDDIDAVVAAEAESQESASGDFEMEFRMRHKAGHWVWVLDRGKIIERDDDGNAVRRMIGTHTDITDRKQAEEKLRSLSQRVQLATKAGGVGLWEYNLKDGSLWWDERNRALYGLEPDEAINYERWINVLHPGDRRRVEDEIHAAVNGDKVFDTEFRVVDRDGRILHVRSMADTHFDKNGSADLMVGTNWDVTQTHDLTTALNVEKERLRGTLESIGDGVICTDINSRVTFMNRIAEIETGWTVDEAMNKPLATVFNLVDEWTERPVDSPVGECLDTRRRAEPQDEVILVNRAGGRQDVRNTAAPILSDGDELWGAVLVFQDITRSRRLQRQLSYSATHDALTDLYNRAAFERELRIFAEAAATAPGQHSLCFIDVDRFKAVNDTAGHAAGDQLLRLIAGTIRSGVRTVDVAARLGGDEFALLLRDCDLDKAVKVGCKIQDAIKDLEFTFGEHTLLVGVSIGIAPIDGTMTPSEILSAADAACYEAKASGRNLVRRFQPVADDKLVAAG